MTAEVRTLFDGDKRLETLMDALCDVTYERGQGLPVPSIIGVLELVKRQIIKDAEEVL